MQVVRALAKQGFNADSAAVSLIASTETPAQVIQHTIAQLPEGTLRLTVEHVETAIESIDGVTLPDPIEIDVAEQSPHNSSSSRDSSLHRATASVTSASDSAGDDGGTTVSATGTDGSPSVEILGDITGQSTGTGTFETFLQTFQDRYQRLSSMLRGRLNHRPAETLKSMAGGSAVAMIGLVNDIQSTKNGHWIVELEDTTGTFPCLVMKDRDIADLVPELCFDECIGIEGTLSNDGEICFVDSVHFPDIPRTYTPSTADRPVSAALISDVHVGSEEFHAAAWDQFTSWLHTEEAERVEYLLIAGDMVEGVGVYPEQDKELTIVDIYDQYERFAELLKDVPGEMEIVMIPGNHDAVRLAEPQPAFDEELRSIMSAHDAHITANPSTVTIDGVSVLMYHGVSLFEVIIDTPGLELENPHEAMYNLLKKRHVAPQYGGQLRLAPEQKDYLVIDEIPDVFHTGHLHTFGYGTYNRVISINTGCWQQQTSYQKSQGIVPDVGYAPILDLQNLDMTIRKFSG